MTRPDHHIEMLAVFEQASEAAELFARLRDFAGNVCSQVGIKDCETVLAAVNERAERRVRRQLAKLIVDQMQPKGGSEQ